MSGTLQTALPPWLAARRAEALQRYTHLGPGPGDEAWRFTNRRALASLPPAPGGTLQLHAPALPAGVRFTSFATLLAQDPDRLQALLALPDEADALSALNFAACTHGYVLEVPAGVEIDAPLHVSFNNQGKAAHLRGLVLLGEGARANLVEQATGRGWTSVVTQIALAGGARLRHAKCQTQALDSVHLAATTVTLGQDADHESVLLALGAATSREAVRAVLAGERAAVSLRGAYLLEGRQEAAFVPEVLHLARHGRSRQLVKGVLGGSAHGVFLGHIGVAEGADGTDARQTSRTLLLSPQARVDTRPRLEILADEVKCSHGATVGDLDEAALFYLLSRGLPPSEARQLLIEAFAAEILDEADLSEAPLALLRQALAGWARALA